MPIIRVEMFEGRTPEQKSNLVKAMTQGFIDTCGGTPDQIHVVIQDVSPGDWGFGGQLVSERIAQKEAGDAK